MFYPHAGIVLVLQGFANKTSHYKKTGGDPNHEKPFGESLILIGGHPPDFPWLAAACSASIQGCFIGFRVHGL